MGELELIPLTVPEVRRLLIALIEPTERFSIRLAWSAFRRHHQAIAKRCHTTRRSLRVHASAAQPTTIPLDFMPNSTSAMDVMDAPGAARIQILSDGNWHFELDEERWKLISPLLPPQKPWTGRPANNHRTILEGMFWVMRSGGSWRDLPASFGPWQTLYSRYQRWCKAGIWQKILDALNLDEAYQVSL